MARFRIWMRGLLEALAEFRREQAATAARGAERAYLMEHTKRIV